MQVDNACLFPTKSLCWLTQNLCLYYGTSEHYIAVWPICPPQTKLSSSTSELLTINPLTTIVTLMAPGFVISVIFNLSCTLIDSRSAGNFIPGNLCRQLQFKKTPNKTMYEVQSVTGRALSQGCVKHHVKSVMLCVGCLHEKVFTPLVLEKSMAV